MLKAILTSTEVIDFGEHTIFGNAPISIYRNRYDDIDLQIEVTTEAAREVSNNTLTLVIDLNERLTRLKQKYLENEIKVQRAENEAVRAEGLANQAEEVQYLVL